VKADFVAYGRAWHLRTISGICYIDDVIDYETGFHGDLLDAFDSEIIMKADFVCSSPVKIMCVCDTG